MSYNSISSLSLRLRHLNPHQCDLLIAIKSTKAALHTWTLWLLSSWWHADNAHRTFSIISQGISRCTTWPQAKANQSVVASLADRSPPTLYDCIKYYHHKGAAFHPVKRSSASFGLFFSQSKATTQFLSKISNHIPISYLYSSRFSHC